MTSQSGARPPGAPSTGPRRSTGTDDGADGDDGESTAWRPSRGARRILTDVVAPLTQERDEYLAALQRTPGRLRQLPQAGAPPAGGAGRPGRPRPRVQAPAGARHPRPGRRPPRRRRAASRPTEGQGPAPGPAPADRHAGQGGARARRRAGASRSTPRSTTPSPTRPTADEDEEPRVRRSKRCFAPATAGGARRSRPAMVRVQGLSVAGPARVVREGLLPGARCALDGHRQGDHAAPIGSWPSSTTPTPTPAPRTASRRSRPPTTCSATRQRARSTTRPAGSARWPAASAGSAAPDGGTFRVEDLGDLGDLFGGLFGGGRRRPQPRGPSAAPTSRPSCTSSFEDAVHGVTTSVNVPEDPRCRTCNGSGRRARAPSTHVCDRCNGRGTLDDNQGLFSLVDRLPQVQRPGHPRRHAVPDLPRHRAPSGATAR